MRWFVCFLIRISLLFRYKIVVKGLDKLKKTGGLLFLPNHTAIFVDPAMIYLSIYKKMLVRPLIADYIYYKPIVYKVMRLINGLPVPDFETSVNSYKINRNKKLIHEIVQGLKNGENFLIYPAGRIKHTDKEIIGGASATQQIIEATPEAEVVLVKITGFWGSSFSRALTGDVPDMFEVIKKGVWIVLKNLLFFTPKERSQLSFNRHQQTFLIKGLVLKSINGLKSGMAASL